MEKEILVNYLELDGKNYIIVNEVDYKNNHYVYLVNEDDKDDIMIKKYNYDILEPLSSREEVDEVLGLLTKKF